MNVKLLALSAIATRANGEDLSYFYSIANVKTRTRKDAKSFKRPPLFTPETIAFVPSRLHSSQPSVTSSEPSNSNENMPESSLIRSTMSKSISNDNWDDGLRVDDKSQDSEEQGNAINAGSQDNVTAAVHSKTSSDDTKLRESTVADTATTAAVPRLPEEDDPVLVGEASLSTPIGNPAQTTTLATVTQHPVVAPTEIRVELDNRDIQSDGDPDTHSIDWSAPGSRCIRKGVNLSTSEPVGIPISFYYQMETVGTDETAEEVIGFIEDVESALIAQACSLEYAGNRQLLQKEPLIVAWDSSPKDVISDDFICSSVSSGDDVCHIIKGSMTVFAISTGDDRHDGGIVLEANRHIKSLFDSLNIDNPSITEVSYIGTDSSTLTPRSKPNVAGINAPEWSESYTALFIVASGSLLVALIAAYLFCKDRSRGGAEDGQRFGKPLDDKSLAHVQTDQTVAMTELGSIFPPAPILLPSVGASQFSIGHCSGSSEASLSQQTEATSTTLPPILHASQGDACSIISALSTTLPPSPLYRSLSHHTETTSTVLPSMSHRTNEGETCSTISPISIPTTLPSSPLFYSERMESDGTFDVHAFGDPLAEATVASFPNASQREAGRPVSPAQMTLRFISTHSVSTSQSVIENVHNSSKLVVRADEKGTTSTWQRLGVLPEIFNCCGPSEALGCIREEISSGSEFCDEKSV